ncbi:MAG: NUDIX domain-containing protein [Ignavibacteria bacterium]|nr:NUDIX domain-containing protein [Ignavibacteria bacterium]
MKLATLLYIMNTDGEYLLMKREREPNKGLLSPPGGKLHTEDAESPSVCAAREAFEECSMRTSPDDWLLRGIVTEKNYPGAGNIMIFIMQYGQELNELPPPCNEGSFEFVKKGDIMKSAIPETDRKFIWNMVLESREQPFIVTLDCTDYPDIVLI